MNILSLINILLLCSVQLNEEYRNEVYSAYINNKMDLWRNVIDRMEAVPGKTDESLLELVNYQYGYIGYCIGFSKKEEARNYLNAALKNVEMLEKKKYSLSEVFSFKAAFYGFRTGLHPVSAMINGIKSVEYAKNAIELDSENWFAYLQYGNTQFYMPSAFGGSKKKALEYYLKAKSLIEKKPKDIDGNWNYLALLVVIGQTHTYLKDYQAAKSVYDNILKIEPGFLYVKNDLYPKLLEKMEN